MNLPQCSTLYLSHTVYVCTCEREKERERERVCEWGGGGIIEPIIYIQSVHDSCILQALLELAETLGPAQSRGLSREGECVFMWCWLV